MSYDISKIVNSKFKKDWIWLLSECKDFLIIFLHIMTHFYLYVQMKSLNNFKCGWIIPNMDIKKGKHSQFFGETTIKASPPICFCLEIIKIALKKFFNQRSPRPLEVGVFGLRESGGGDGQSKLL